MDDSEIIRRVQSGDSEAFSLLVEKYHRHLLNFIYRIIGDEKIVEDIGQEVFLSIYKSIEHFDVRRGTPFSAWLFMSARNRCISELRKSRGRTAVPLEETGDLAVGERSPEEEAMEGERMEAIRAALEQIPEPFKSSLLRSLKGDSLEEIAQETGVSVGTAKSRLFRARQRMKALLQKHFGGKGYERV